MDNTASVQLEINKLTASVVGINDSVNHESKIVFRAFVNDIFMDIYTRSPVDAGLYRGDWELKEINVGDIFTLEITNDKIYSPVMETGSKPGSYPWPNVGPKTVSSNGRIWSSQMPEPVAGGALESADLDGLSEQLAAIVEKGFQK